MPLDNEPLPEAAAHAQVLVPPHPSRAQVARSAVERLAQATPDGSGWELPPTVELQHASQAHIGCTAKYRACSRIHCSIAQSHRHVLVKYEAVGTCCNAHLNTVL